MGQFDDGEPTLFRGGLTFTGKGPPRSGLGVLVRGKAIESVAPVGDFTGYEGRVYDTADHTLLPGLIDCHVHLCLEAADNPQQALSALTDGAVCARVLENAQSLLRGGVTTARDLGGRDWLELGFRDAFDEGRQLGPTIRAAGKVVCITGGHAAWVGIEADGADEVTKAVRLNIKAGVDWIKIVATGGVLTRGHALASQLTLAEMRAAVETAHSLGRRVAAHALGLAGVVNAVEAGVDSIEHGFELTDEVIAAMIEKGVILVPTLSASKALVEHPDRLPPDVREKAAQTVHLRTESFRRYVRAGGLVAMGTDAGSPNNHFVDAAQELAQMVELGMSTVAALEAATSVAATLLDIPAAGCIEAGADADLLIVRGDVQSDIRAVANRLNHALVLKGGRDISAALPIKSFRRREHTPAAPAGWAKTWSGCSCFLE